VVVRTFALVAVEDAVGCLLVPVADLLRGAVEGERGRAALHAGGTVDAVRAVQERDPSATEVESLGKRGVRDVDSPRRLQHVERGEARAPDVVVAHGPILGWIATSVKEPGSGKGRARLVGTAGRGGFDRLVFG
jgi:hypothetical protein